MVERSETVCRILQRDYEQTGNPLYLFLAYQECRKSGQPIEEWILSYFDSVSEQIFDEVKERRDGADPGTRRCGDFLRDFMAPNCHGDIFNRFIIEQEKVKTCIRYAELKAQDTDRADLSIRLDIDDETGKNYKTLEGWIKNYSDTYSRWKKEMEIQKAQEAAVKRCIELISNEQERSIFDILQEVANQFDIDRIRLNTLVNIRLKSL